MSERSLLPGNATPLEASLSTAANARMGALDVNIIRRERQPGSCGPAFLPLLAFERSIHHWLSGDDAGDRAKIAASFSDHGLYGSPTALEAEIEADTGQTIVIREFFEYGGEWPGFRFDSVIDPGDPPPNLAAAKASAIARKNVRELFEGARILARQPSCHVSVAAAAHMSSNATIYPVGGFAPPPTLVTGASTRAIATMTVLPLRKK